MALGADSTFAGTPGALRGITRDPDGQPLAQAQVTLCNVADKFDLTVVSGSDGVFLVGGLKPGQYQLTAKAEGFATASPTIVDIAADQQTSTVNVPLAKSVADPEISPAVAKALQAMQKRIEQLEAELKSKNAQQQLTATAAVPVKPATEPPRTLLATITKDPGEIPVLPGTLSKQDEKTVVASNAAVPPKQETQPPAQAPAAPAVDTQTPFAFGDFTWLNGSPRNKDVVLDTPFFTPEVRFDTHYMTSFNQPRDHTIVGATESFRSGEVQIEQASVGGDFHWQNVRGRINFMQGLFATTTPRNDASAGVGNWDLRGAYKYVSEAYGGYHFNVNHGLNVDAGIFVSYIGLFSYYNFDNWTYQPSYVSSNTPWFFNGVRVQWFPTNKLKIEPWFINGWQSYAKYNGHPGLGGQLLWMPKEWFKLVANQYGYGQDNLGLPHTERIHTDDSIEIRYYNNPTSTRLSKMAFSLTADAGAQYGGGLCGTCAPSKGKESFVGWMLYDRLWFHKDLFAITFGGGQMSNYGRYLTLLPPINGADAVTGSPYFTETPGQKAHMWDSTVTLQYMPRQYITWWAEVGYRHSDVPYFAGRGGVTPPGYPLGGTNGAPGQYACLNGAPSGASDLATAKVNCGSTGVWFPDLRRSEAKVSVGVMVKF